MTVDAEPGRDAPRVLRVAGPSASVFVDGHERELRLPVVLEGGPAAAGDLVELSDDGGGIRRVLPRASVLRRGGPRGTRVIAANADLMIAVESVIDPELRPRFLDRYLAAAEIGGLDAAIVLTKIDLPHDQGAIHEITRRYEDIGYTVLPGVAFDADFADRVRQLIGGRLAVLAGHSGVGKSTLTTALTGVKRETGAVSEKARSGRHTTTDPRLIPLPRQGAVIDTAGVRTFHLPDLDEGDLAFGFREIARLAPGCRFRGCRHRGEEGCAVPGNVSQERLDSYRQLLSGP